MLSPDSSATKAIEEYQRYRRASKDLHDKIVRALVGRDIIDEAMRALGLGRGRRLLLDNESDADVLMEYALYEVRRGGLSLVARYKQTPGGSSAMERELLEAMVVAQTGLFRVESVLPQQSRLALRSLGEDGRDLILTDINFSQTLADQMIVFIRPIEVAGLAMTSGMAFVFPPDMEPSLTARWQRDWAGGRSAKRYAALYRLSKHKGMPTQYAQP
jgi:hypothetical protein